MPGQDIAPGRKSVTYRPLSLAAVGHCIRETSVVGLEVWEWTHNGLYVWEWTTGHFEYGLWRPV